MKNDKPSRPSTGHIAPFGLRMQPELRGKLETAAIAAGRSMNAEITARLEDSFPSAEDEMQETIRNVQDVAMNIMRSLSPEEFRYFLYRVKRSNWEHMGMDPEKMPPSPPTPKLDKPKDRKPGRTHEVAMLADDDIKAALTARAETAGRSIEDELAVVIQESLKKIGLLPPDEEQ